jgi:hypothetical protein
MDIEKIRELRLAWPFKPFDLVLDNGRRLPVANPFHLAFGDTFLLYTGGREGFETLSPAAVKKTTYRKGRMKPLSTGTRNGRTGRVKR